MIRFFIAALLCIASPLAVAQRAKPTFKPVSRYMQDVGILYLETVGQLTLDCGRKSIADSDCVSQWESTMDGLEDRIKITLSDTSRKYASLSHQLTPNPSTGGGQIRQVCSLCTEKAILCTRHAPILLIPRGRVISTL